MNKVLILFVLTFTFNSWALSGKEVWLQTSNKEKVTLLNEYKTFIQALSQKENLGEYQTPQTGFINLFMSEAWAAGKMDCIYAGWPSKRINNLCSSPMRNNPDYEAGNCRSNELQCQPLFFGKGLCVSAATPQARSLAFTNCDKKKKLTTEQIIQQVQKENKEAALFDLMDFADDICKKGKQAGTGMCKRLENTVSRIREKNPKEQTATQEAPKDSAVAQAPAAREPTAEAAAVIEVEVKAEEPKAEDKKQEPAEASIPVMVESMEKAQAVIQDPAALVECEEEVVSAGFDREEPRNTELGYVSTKSAKDGIWSDKFILDKTLGRLYKGFELKNKGPNDIAGNFSTYIEPAREWQFISEDNSRRETYIWITDHPVSKQMESVLVLVPRKVQPVIEAVGDEVHVTLTTGEKVIFDKDSKVIKSGALQESKVDVNGSSPKFPGVKYSGAGISIRINHKGEDPRQRAGTAVIEQNGKTCRVPTKDLWIGRSFRYSDDSKLVKFINDKCSADFSL